MKFSALFKRRVRRIEERARAAGSNITDLCRRSEVARVTVERWRKEAPKTIEIIDQLEAELDKLERRP